MRRYTDDDYPLLRQLLFLPAMRNTHPGIADCYDWLTRNGINISEKDATFGDLCRLDRAFCKLFEEARYALYWKNQYQGTSGSFNDCYAVLHDIARRDLKDGFTLLGEDDWTIQPLPQEGETVVLLPNEHKDPKFLLLNVFFKDKDNLLYPLAPPVLVDRSVMPTAEDISHMATILAAGAEFVQRLEAVDHIHHTLPDEHHLIQLMGHPNELLNFNTYVGSVVDVISRDHEVICRNVLHCGLVVHLALLPAVSGNFRRLVVRFKLRTDEDFTTLCSDMPVTITTVNLLRKLCYHPKPPTESHS